MFLLYCLNTYKNFVKYLQKVPLDVSIGWFHLHQHAEKTYYSIQKYQIWNHTGSIQKHTSGRHMKKNIGDLAVTKEQSGKTNKTVCSTKEKYLTTNQVLARRDGKLFCKKRLIVKAGIPPSIREETSRRDLQKIYLKWTHFQRKGILSKNDMRLWLKFALKVCRKHAMWNGEIWNHQKVYGTREMRS